MYVTSPSVLGALESRRLICRVAEFADRGDPQCLDVIGRETVVAVLDVRIGRKIAVDAIKLLNGGTEHARTLAVLARTHGPRSTGPGPALAVLVSGSTAGRA
jgi:hypothetical protein